MTTNFEKFHRDVPFSTTPSLLPSPPHHWFNPNGLSAVCSPPPNGFATLSFSASAAFAGPPSLFPNPTPAWFPNASPPFITPPTSGSTMPPTGRATVSRPLPAYFPTGARVEEILSPAVLPRDSGLVAQEPEKEISWWVGEDGAQSG